MKEASWPIFIAAPFILPSVSTIRSAASRWRARAPRRPAPASARGWRRACRRSARPGCRPPSPPAPCAGPGRSGIALSSVAATPREPIGRRAALATLARRHGRRKATHTRRRGAPRARHARGPPPAPRGLRARRRLRRQRAATASRSRSTRASCATCWSDGSALIDLKVGGKTPPGDRQGPAAPPRPRRADAHRPARGPPRREDPDARSPSQLEGVEEAPGVKEGGVLEQVTRQLNIEALPTDIPDDITVDVSGMEIAATMHLSELTPPEGVDVPRRPRGDDHRHGRRPDRGRGAREIEEETELVGEDGEPTRATRPPRARRAPRRRPRARRRRRGGRGAPSEPLPPRRRAARSTGWSWASATRATATPGTRHNVGFEVANAGRRALGPAEARRRYAGLYTDGRTGPAARAWRAAAADLHERARAARSGPPAARSACDLDRVVVGARRDRPAVRDGRGPASAAGWPATTG